MRYMVIILINFHYKNGKYGKLKLIIMNKFQNNRDDFVYWLNSLYSLYAYKKILKLINII